MSAKVVKIRPDVSIDYLLRIALIAEFTRVEGVGMQYGELLEAAGFDLFTLRETASREVLQRLLEANHEKGVTPRPPTLSQVARWRLAAQRLAPLVRR
jgi:hypothetical protein